MFDSVRLCERVMLADTLGVSGMGMLSVSLCVIDALKLREVDALRVSDALTEEVSLWDSLRLFDSLWVLESVLLCE